MKTLILFLLFPLFTFSQLQTDKVAHFSVGYGIGATVTAFTPKQKPAVSILLGFGTGLIVGVGKEIYDAKGHGNPEFKDALYTGLGAGLGSVTVRFSINQYGKKNETHF